MFDLRQILKFILVFNIHSFKPDKIQKIMENNNLHCKLCKKVFITRTELTEHKNISKSDYKIIIQNEDWKCSDCDYVTKSISKLTRHRENRALKSTLSQCCYCSYTSCYAYNVKVHIKQQHSSSENDIQNNGSKEKSNNLKPKESMKFPCGSCDQSFDLRFELKKHLKNQRTSKLVCNLCSFTSCTYNGMKTIKKVKDPLSNEITYCKVCYNIFKTSMEQDNPQQNSKKDEKWKQSCSKCDYSPRDAKILERHMKLFSKLGDVITCSYCTYKGCTPRIISLHMKKEHGKTYKKVSKKKKFDCKRCGFKFSKQSNQILHTERNKNSEVQNCDICKFKTCSKMVLLSHTLSKHSGKSYFCERCNHSFVTATGLYKHQKYKNFPIKECKFCDFKCCNPNIISKHIFHNHKDEKVKKIGKDWEINDRIKLSKSESPKKLHRGENVRSGSLRPPRKGYWSVILWKL